MRSTLPKSIAAGSIQGKVHLSGAAGSIEDKLIVLGSAIDDGLIVSGAACWIDDKMKTSGAAPSVIDDELKMPGAVGSAIDDEVKMWGAVIDEVILSQLGAVVRQTAHREPDVDLFEGYGLPVHARPGRCLFGLAVRLW